MSDDVPLREVGDARSLKALGHPLRQRILRALLRDGPATATSLGARLGEHTGATSYHLRRLADHGFVEDVPERAKGRVRWWRARAQDVRYLPRSAMTADAQLALDAVSRLDADEDDQAWARFLRRRDELGSWGDAHLFSRGALRLTQAELLAFWHDYLALVLRYRHDRPGESGDEESTSQSGEEDPSGTRRILVRFMAFPDVD